MIQAKVVHIITKMELGGAQENTLFTVTHLNSELFRTFLVVGRGGELFEEARELQNTFIIPDMVRAIRPLQDIKAFYQIKGILQKIKNCDPVSVPVIVHTHSSKAGILGRWAAKASGISLILHSIHGYGFNDYQSFLVKKFYVLLEKLTSRITTKFIAVSRGNIEKGVTLNIFPRNKVVLIRSGIDINRFQSPQTPKTGIRKSLGIPDTALVVVMVACFKPQKAPLDFIRACGLVKREVSGSYFLLVGDGELRTAIQEEIRRQNLQECFCIPGWRRDVPEILHAADVFALSSLWEGLPRVLPQAMCAGIPIVATRVDGSPEAVHHGVNGFLVHPGDIKGLAEKIIFCLKNPGEAVAMGIRGRNRVGEFDIYKMVKDQEDIYSGLLPHQQYE
jgi:glycosyltransferase involved in cell wall biosynthesis